MISWMYFFGSPDYSSSGYFLIKVSEEVTPEEQRVKFISLAQRMEAHPDFKEKYAQNPDIQNRDLAFRRIFDEVMASQRKKELGLYRLLSKDEAFKTAMQETLKRILRA